MREQQTLGRRIQEARKAAGLSQESLGERLGVSRQAVSKWEADAAVPELENLIAMSRIFGVTIGALLGVEPEAAEDRSEKDAPEAPGEGVEGTAPAGELTDRELAAVEAIVQKYLEAVRRPRWSRRRKFLAGAAVCAVLVLAAPLEQLIIAQLLTCGAKSMRSSTRSATSSISSASSMSPSPALCGNSAASSATIPSKFRTMIWRKRCGISPPV